MKIKLILSALFAIALSVAASAQNQSLRTTSGKLIRFRVDTLTTFNATPVIMDTIGITDNTAGILEVTVVGASAVGDGITGKLIYRFKKVSGTLTVATADTASAITADTNLSGGTFAVATTSYGNAKLTVTGKSAVTVRWRSVIYPYFGY